MRNVCCERKTGNFDVGINHDSNRFSLTITPEKTDKHRYECKADNGIGIPATRTFVVVGESEFSS